MLSFHVSDYNSQIYQTRMQNVTFTKKLTLNGLQIHWQIFFDIEETTLTFQIGNENTEIKKERKEEGKKERKKETNISQNLLCPQAIKLA